MQFPRPVDPSGGVRTPIVRTGVADASGTVTVTIDPDRDGLARVVEYVVVATTGTSAACDLYVDTVGPSTLWDYTSDGNGAVAAYNPPRTLLPGQTLLAVFTGMNAGETATVRVEYDAVGA